MVDEIKTLKCKLDYLYREYGRIEDMDYNLFLYKVKKLKEYETDYAKTLKDLIQ